MMVMTDIPIAKMAMTQGMIQVYELDLYTRIMTAEDFNNF